MTRKFSDLTKKMSAKDRAEIKTRSTEAARGAAARTAPFCAQPHPDQHGANTGRQPERHFEDRKAHRHVSEHAAELRRGNGREP